MHAYRTHTCNDLRSEHKGQTVKLSGWIHRKRDHGGLLFVDLRDHYGLTQCVVNVGTPVFEELEHMRLESVVCVEGEVVARADGTANKNLPTGDVEVRVASVQLLSAPIKEMLPLQVNSDDPYGEEVRLKYRYLDLRREVMHRNIVLRCNVISSLRRRMVEHGFLEFQTPILTASSPEGARDFIVPSRLHPGKFYALPQAPQQFKQLLMMSGFDRYFQIAPCFRDEDARADRTAGEFYQLDVEMAFVTQEDVLAVMEDVIGGMFEEFSDFTGVKYETTKGAFPRIGYEQAMLEFGSDKPDLRNPLRIVDVSAVFARDDVDFQAFKSVLAKGGVVRAIRAPSVADKPRSFFDKLNAWARQEDAPGLGYVMFEQEGAKGPIAKFMPPAALQDLAAATGATAGDAVFFVCDTKTRATVLSGKARNRIAQEMDIVEKNTFKFCWVVDYPMFEINEQTNQIDFLHNPFSMPVGGLEALEKQDPLSVRAIQYDCVLNGVELCSGGVRNHIPEVMEKAFEIAGYAKETVREKFGGMYNAFGFGAPPHGGCAFGIDRMVMFLANQSNVREIIAFPMNQQAEDLLMSAPSIPDPQQLRDVHIRVDLPAQAVKAAG